jgi:hypothetical protein
MMPDEIYSPETSDNSRFGDWKSKLVFWIVWVPILSICAWGLIRLFSTANL